MKTEADVVNLGYVTLWSVVAQLEYPLVLTAVVFPVAFVAMLVAVTRVFGTGGPVGADRWKVGLPVGLLAGWVSVAIFANWSVAMKTMGVGDGHVRRSWCPHVTDIIREFDEVSLTAREGS